MPRDAFHPSFVRLRAAVALSATALGLLALGCGSSDSGGSVCPGTQVDCGGGCVDVNSEANCGACGNVCGLGQQCALGADGPSCACDNGLGACGTECVDLKSDPGHCGVCGQACAPGLVCSNGECLATCGVGLSPCAGACVDLNTHALHCGTCETTCDPGQACAGAQCTCVSGEKDCGNGCVDVLVDPAHCGDLCLVCGVGQACVGGVCQDTNPGVGGASAAGGASTGGAPVGGADPVGGASAGGTGGAFATGGGANSGCNRTGFYVEDGLLYDKNCNEFILRGANVAHAWYNSQTEQSFKDLSAKGGNVARVVLATGDRWDRTTGATVSQIINWAKASKLIAVLEVHDTTGYSEQSESVALDKATAYWTSPDIVSALEGQEAYVILNIGNEPNGNNTTSQWAPSHVNSIQAIRAAGLHHTVMIDGPNWGQDHENTMRSGGGSVIWEADPDKNLVFSVHMYQVYATANTITSFFTTYLANNEAPLVVGEFAADHGASYGVDENTIINTADSLGIGYMGWSWSGNGSGLESLDITQNFNVNNLTPWGDRLLNGENGIAETGVKCTVFN